MRATRSVAVSLIALAACVVGYRGITDQPFTGDESLTDLDGQGTNIDAVRIDLPSTPIDVVGCTPLGAEPCGFNLEWTGVWHSTAGSKKDAEDNILASEVRMLTLDNFAELRAYIPADIVHLIELEMDEVRLPADRDLEVITSVGDVEVSNHDASLLIDVDVGAVTVNCQPTADQCGTGGVAVNTGDGRVKVYTRGNADIRTASGHVEVYQFGSNAIDLYVSSRSGDVFVELASDANLDLRIKGDDIVVNLDTINTVTRKSFTREVGNGTHRVEIDASGDVDVTRTNL